MKAAWLVVVCVATVAAVMLPGCGDDGSIVEPDPKKTVPDIPEPAFYGDPDVPVKSEELILDTCYPTEFHPIVTAARFPSPGYIFDPDTMYTLDRCGDDSPIHRYPLIEDDAIDDNPLIGLVVPGRSGCPPSDVHMIPAYPLAGRPILQYVRYWVRLDAVEYYAGGVEISVDRTVTTGMSETHAQSFTKTLGIEASISGSWFVSFSVTVRTEFEWSESSETTYSEEHSVTNSFTIHPEADKNVGYAVWTLVEEFRFVDENGDPFTDWGYTFDGGSIAAAVHRTTTTVPVSTYFDE